MKSLQNVVRWFLDADYNYDYLIGGDYNINLITYQENSNVSNYVDCLTSRGCISLINKPTRFSKNSKPSLLDHIYTNICDEKKNYFWNYYCLYF